MSDQVSDFVQCLIENVVQDPESVSVREQQRDRGTQYTVRVAGDDIGRLIGKGGKVINAIRRIVDASADHNHIQIKVITE